MSSIVIRQAVLADLDALVPLFDAYRQFYGQESDLAAAREFLRARFNHGESVLFLALNEDRPVGFCQLYPSFSSVTLQRIYVLNDLFVVVQARRLGVARGLLNAACDYAQRMGAVRITLSTGITNVTAQSLYLDTGWKRDEQFFVYHYHLPA